MCLTRARPHEPNDLHAIHARSGPTTIRRRSHMPQYRPVPVGARPSIDCRPAASPIRLVSALVMTVRRQSSTLVVVVGILLAFSGQRTTVVHNRKPVSGGPSRVRSEPGRNRCARITFRNEMADRPAHGVVSKPTVLGPYTSSRVSATLWGGRSHRAPCLRRTRGIVSRKLRLNITRKNFCFSLHVNRVYWHGV